MDWMTVEIAKEVEALRKKEYSYNRIVEHIQESYPSLNIKVYRGLGYIICREAASLLQNRIGTTFNED